MTHRPEDGPRRCKLYPDSQTLVAFFEYGRHKRTKAEIGRIHDCRPQTVYNFMKRYPQVRRAYESGMEAGRESCESLAEVRRQTPGDRPPQPGETCPTCHQTVGGGEETITITAAALKGARRELEALIDRHIAARTAEQA